MTCDAMIKQDIKALESDLFTVIAAMSPIDGDDCPKNAELIGRAESITRKLDSLNRTLAIREEARKYHQWK